MQKLPVLSAHEVIKYLISRGFEIVGRKGSHIRLKKFNGKHAIIVIVPDHREIAPGTLLSIIRQSKIPKDKFLGHFNR